ncbi:DUF4179 domain-containing protein [Thermoflavimicrobium dichotomicum]|uniref:DUF4179 domain-containing protein n=1 Tax=Thermoflavimicrobium dichotomicum TaxID=46223 RepID=UPI0015879770|nr:DUF4179 domain-containing protein [Thermoflavimicrobium dichotomicum]
MQEEWNEIPEMVLSRIEETLTSLPEKKKRGNQMKKIWLAATAASFMIAGTITAGLISPSFAATLNKVPVIGSIFEKIGDKGVKNAVKKGVTTNQINQTQEKDGVKLTIKDIIYDDTSLIISYEIKQGRKLTGQKMTVQTKKGKRTVPFPTPHVSFIFKHNGKQLKGAVSGSIKEKNEHTIMGYESHQLEQPLPDKVKLQLKAFYSDPMRDNPQENKPLQFDFTVTAQKEKNNKIFKPNITQSIGDINVEIKQVKVSSSYIQLDIKRFAPLDYTNPYSYSLHDENGKEIESLYEAGDLKMTKLTFVSPMESPKSLTLKIYKNKKEIGQVKIPLK